MVTVMLLTFFKCIKSSNFVSFSYSPDRHIADIFDVRGDVQVCAEGAQGGALGVLAVLQGSVAGQHHELASSLLYNLMLTTCTGMYFLLSRTQAGPGRTVKQEQEEISSNHVQTFISPSVVLKKM